MYFFVDLITLNPNRKKFLCPQQSLNLLKNFGKPRKGVSPSAVYVSSPNVKSALLLCEFALITHNTP